jgi:hypothetical protein
MTIRMRRGRRDRAKTVSAFPPAHKAERRRKR